MPTAEDIEHLPDQPDEHGSGADDQIEDRRKRVLGLRIRKMTISAIAAVVQVNRSTVCRDLAWIHEHWRGRYGKVSTIDPSLVVGETLETYSDIEQHALRANALAIEMMSEADAELAADEPGGQTVPARVKTARLRRRRVRAAKVILMAMRQQQMALRTALMARREQMSLMTNLGLVDHNLGKLSTLLDLPSVEDLRETVKAMRELHPMHISLMPPAERRWRKIPDDPPDTPNRPG